MDIYILICVCVLSIFIFLHTHIYIFMYTCVCLLILPMSNLEFSNEKIIPTIYAICWFALENIVLPFLRTRFLILDEWFDFQSRPRAFLVKVLESKKNLKNLEFWCHTIASLVLQPIRQTIVWLLIFHNYLNQFSPLLFLIYVWTYICMCLHMFYHLSIYLSVYFLSIYLLTKNLFSLLWSWDIFLPLFTSELQVLQIFYSRTFTKRAVGHDWKSYYCFLGSPFLVL
jgi:hypothetical protein